MRLPVPVRSVAAVLPFLLLGACVTPPTSANRNPELRTAKNTPAGATYRLGATVAFDVSAQDPDGDTLSYTWTATGGSLSSHTDPSTTWTAPMTPGTYSVGVQITDGKGGSNGVSWSVRVEGDGVTPSPTPTPTPIGDNFGSDSEGIRATIHGTIYDEADQRLGSATVTAKALGGTNFANGSDTLVTMSQIGSYALNGAPTGVTILVTVSKDGMTRREQTIVPLANLTGDPTVNQLDFGSANGQGLAARFAPSDKPEVSQLAQTPGGFILTFSEPVHPADVESLLAVYAASDAPSGAYALSGGATLPVAYGFADDLWATAKAPVLSAQAFTVSWSDNFRVANLQLKPGFCLPTDEDEAKLPRYAVSFTGPLRDSNGNARGDGWFRLQSSLPNRSGAEISVAADKTPPQVVGVTAQTSTGARLRVQFSEPMVLTVGGLSNGVTMLPVNGSALSPAFYHYAIANSQPGQFPLQASGLVPFALGAGGQSIEFAPAQDTDLAAGNTLWVEINPQVCDPAGNRIDPSNFANVKHLSL